MEKTTKYRNASSNICFLNVGHKGNIKNIQKQIKVFENQHNFFFFNNAIGL